MLRLFVWMLSGMMLLGATAALAGTTGKVAGRVVDLSGEPLPGVQIMIEETGQGTVSDANGYYSIVNIKPGTYVVMFRYVGFATTRVENVEVIIDKTTTIDVEMQEEVIQGQEVVVTAERPIVEMDRTTTTSFVDQKQLETLPVRSLGDVINLQAGVVEGHFRGGRSGEVAYLVNGVPITNPYSNSAAFEVEKNMVSGLEVISGVFGAEYGQAMSGVVNIITKDVPRDWSGSVSGELGGILSTREVEFVERTAPAGATLGLGDFQSVYVPYYKAANPIGRRDVQLTLGGPIIREKLGIQVTGRYVYDESHVIGRRLFMPSDSSRNITSDAPEAWVIESTGDQAYVPSESQRYSFNGTLTYRFTPKVRAEYNLFWQNGEGRNVDRYRKYVPDGINRYYNDNQFHLFGLRLTITNKSFASINYSYLRDAGESRLYQVPGDFEQTGLLDARYVSPRLATLQGINAFQMGGNDLFNAADLTQTHTFLADYTSQVNRVHQVKAGISARLHSIDNGSYGIELGPRTSYQPMMAVDRYGRDTLSTRPYELAAYVQDKMEFKNLIVNAGLRFDFFQPDFLIPIDWTQADRERIPNLDVPGDSLYNRRQADVRWQISPRLGIAFPISATGVVRFSAGLFFQVPQLSFLYQNPEFEVNPSSSTTYFGNPSIDPERTLHFEIGLQQGLSESMGVEVTVFSKDIRNLTGVEVRRDVATTNNFVRYINRDVGTSSGITFSLFQRPVGALSWDIDYTLQFAEGTSSNPDQAFQRYQAAQGDILTLVRLNWDRRHVLTNSITIDPARSLSLNFINRFMTGTPYTTIRSFTESYIENNGTRPSGFLSDARLFFRPPILKGGLSLLMQVENIFDAQVHYGVYNDTGRADESVTMELYRRAGTIVRGVNSLDEYYINQDRFSAPRRVSVGLQYNF